MQFRLATSAVVVVACATLVHAQPPTTCSVTGVVTSSRQALPGVVVSLVQTSESVDVVDASSSSLDGTFTLKAPAGAYKLRAELTGFAPVLLDLTIEEGCGAPSAARPIRLQMTLASRVETSTTSASPSAPSGPPVLRGRSSAGAVAATNGGDR